MTGRAWCRRCRAVREFDGAEKVSDSGMVRVLGRCPACGLRLKAIVGKVVE